MIEVFPIEVALVIMIFRYMTWPDDVSYGVCSISLLLELKYFEEANIKEKNCRQKYLATS